MQPGDVAILELDENTPLSRATNGQQCVVLHKFKDQIYHVRLERGVVVAAHRLELTSTGVNRGDPGLCPCQREE
jgi:hypothetical protein